MAIESASYIAQLDQTNPGGGDSRATSDDHHRLIKTAVKQTFPNMRSEVSASAAEANALVGIRTDTSVQAQINDLSASYHSAIAVASANLDAQIAALSATLDNDIRTVSATLSDEIRTLSATYDARVSAVSAVANAALPTSGGTVSGYAYMDVLFIEGASFRNITVNTAAGTGPSINWRTSNKAQVSLNSNSATFSFISPLGPTNLLLKLVQDGVGGRKASWPASVKWAYGDAPTLSTTAGATDIVTLYYDGSAYYGTFSLGFE